MNQPWIAVNDELPALGEVVEVWLSLPRVSGTTWMRGKLVAGQHKSEVLWLNAVTGEPFPQGWEVKRWRSCNSGARAPDAMSKRA